MTDILINGCNGKMGQVITRIVSEKYASEARVVCGVDIMPDAVKNAYPVFAKIDECDIKCDVVIDFSHPSALAGVLSYCIQSGTAAVIATTGLSPEQKESLRDASKQIPIFFSANMSLGINLLIELAQKAAKLMEGSFDIEIVEKHHNQKIDAPSGTALAIADAINDVLAVRDDYVYDRHLKREKRSEHEIGLHAVRGGNIVGEHEVIFAGIDEVIELKHHASSKEVFAVGAIKSAIFMNGQPAGFYSMKELVAQA